MLQMMEKILGSAPDIEICYANIDSIHFSLPSDHFQHIMEALQPQISDKMGDCKVDAIAKYGLWLEPGRYWLYTNEIKKFRNRSIGIRGNAFADHAIHVTNRKIGDLNIPIRLSIKMENSMSDMRSIIDDPVSGIARQKPTEVGDGKSHSDILNALEYNRTECVPRRMQAFRRLAQSMGTDKSRRLETCQNSQV